MRRRALVAHMRMPEIDRDRGSGRVDAMIRFLLADGWAVTFLSNEEAADPRHVARLRQLGVAVYAGPGVAPEVVRDGDFDLALISFWKVAAGLVPILREHSPRTKIIIDSQDVHFLREARRRFGLDGRLDGSVGTAMVDELNTYRGADAVLAVSAKEGALLGDFLGGNAVFDIALGEAAERSPLTFAERQGMLFVGNFRHLPNGEAVEYLCLDVLPRLDPALLAAHPLTVIGNRLDDKIRAFAKGLPGVDMVGWVPSVEPYLRRARVAVAPLLHGAGVKGKVVEAMMTGTPVVTTPIGAEGLDLTPNVHAMIFDEPADLAAAITRLLVDERTWQTMADTARELIAPAQDMTAVADRFHGIVERVVTDRRRGVDRFRHARAREARYQVIVRQALAAMRSVCEPGSTVAVATHGDTHLLDLPGRTGWHFPQDRDGGWGGFHPADSDTAVRHLEAMRERGAGYFVLPTPQFWWLHYYRELAEHLDRRYRRVHADAHCVVYDIRTVRPAVCVSGDRPVVVVLGTHTSREAGPSPALVSVLGSSERFEVRQQWRPAGTPAPDVDDAAWVVHVEAQADLPSGFLDDFLPVAERLGADRAQPAHVSGPEAAPPVSERLLGCAAREVAGWLPLPVRAVRAGAAVEGTVVLVDEVPIRLLWPVRASTGVEVVDVLDASGAKTVSTYQSVATPRISVLISTYERPELLAGALQSMVEQTLLPSEFEVVVVDDGSSGPETGEVVERFRDRLQLTSARLEHAGRSAAKNLAIMLARGEIVVLFDDDDRAAPDMLAEHLRVHDAAGDEALAVLGHTSWAPELEITPFMHWVTEVGKMLFAYGNLTDGQVLNWKGFWEGRISCRRALLMRAGLHDQRLNYSIDVEMAWRLRTEGLRVVYTDAARSVMARDIDLPTFCVRTEQKAAAQVTMAALHDDDELRKYTNTAGVRERWDAERPLLAAAINRAAQLEAAGEVTDELHGLYRQILNACYAKGAAEALGAPRTELPKPVVGPVASVRPVAKFVMPEAADDDLPVQVMSARTRVERPQLTVTIPVWSRTPELADMAVATIERLRANARLATEIVVIDNGSPHEREFDAEVYRYDSNRGVSIAWNAGIALASAPVIAILNSDCLVEPGWDEALYEAAVTGRRVAFPYTDHADGQGFRTPDQGGTAGWCFMATAAIFAEVGEFDIQFSPAFCEDTDYWHRAWQLGIELTPVPAARVSHARRSTGRTDPHVDWLLTSHRYKYGWKHGVEPMKAPPYYNRAIVEYVSDAGERTRFSGRSLELLHRKVAAPKAVNE
ncbi:MAG: glycosyltransferase [Jatrophihabitans sp.]|uniref:glycosyltransferase n=1 Tax=Jatrophihabitans sp. TaxID=1932789 RepID=UPI003F7E3A15